MISRGLQPPAAAARAAGMPKIELPITALTTAAVRSQRPMARTRVGRGSTRGGIGGAHDTRGGGRTAGRRWSIMARVSGRGGGERVRRLWLAVAVLALASEAAAEGGETILVHFADGSSLPLRSWSLSYEYSAWRRGESPALGTIARKEAKEIW